MVTEGSGPSGDLEELARSFEETTSDFDLSSYAAEDWLTLAVFWGMVTCVVLQFFTRYVLNNSLAWTEEVAAVALVVVVFLGAVMCVRRDTHIRVDLVQRLAPLALARSLQSLVDIFVLVFFAYMAWLTWRYLAVAGGQLMITVDVSRSWLYQSILLAFGLMFFRAAQRWLGRVTSSASAEGRSI
jgi:TRAP-type C4-dicarboxylate transport system permease small subunit